jgi:hypothetical protein
MQAWTTRKQVGQQSVLSLGSEKLNGQENESSVDRCIGKQTQWAEVSSGRSVGGFALCAASWRSICEEERGLAVPHDQEESPFLRGLNKAALGLTPR